MYKWLNIRTAFVVSSLIFLIPFFLWSGMQISLFSYPEVPNSSAGLIVELVIKNKHVYVSTWTAKIYQTLRWIHIGGAGMMTICVLVAKGDPFRDTK